MGGSRAWGRRGRGRGEKEGGVGGARVEGVGVAWRRKRERGRAWREYLEHTAPFVIPTGTILAFRCPQFLS